MLSQEFLVPTREAVAAAVPPSPPPGGVAVGGAGAAVGGAGARSVARCRCARRRRWASKVTLGADAFGGGRDAAPAPMRRGGDSGAFGAAPGEPLPSGEPPARVLVRRTRFFGDLAFSGGVGHANAISSAQSRRNSARLLPESAAKELAQTAKSLWRDVVTPPRELPVGWEDAIPAQAGAASGLLIYRRCSRRSASCRSGCSGARRRRPATPPSRQRILLLLSKSRADLVVLVPRADVRASRALRRVGLRVARLRPTEPARLSSVTDAEADVLCVTAPAEALVRVVGAGAAGSLSSLRQQAIALELLRAGSVEAAGAAAFAEASGSYQMVPAPDPDAGVVSSGWWRKARCSTTSRCTPRASARRSARAGCGALAFRAAARRDRWVPRREGGAVLLRGSTFTLGCALRRWRRRPSSSRLPSAPTTCSCRCTRSRSSWRPRASSSCGAAASRRSARSGRGRGRRGVAGRFTRGGTTRGANGGRCGRRPQGADDADDGGARALRDHHRLAAPAPQGRLSKDPDASASASAPRSTARSSA